MTGFGQRYGPWALVAGASEGIGAAFAEALAAWGLDLVLVARRPEPLRLLAQRLPVHTVPVAADLSTGDGVAAVTAATAGLEVGLVVHNAAYSPVGPFVAADPAESLRALDLNCRALLLLAHAYLPAMAARRRGGFVVMSSLAGQQGSPGLAAYAASKAFGATLAEGLWGELRGSGVDVLTCVAGAVAMPGPDHTADHPGPGRATGRPAGHPGPGRATGRPAPGTVTPDEVARTALAGLGRGPRTVPGAFMRVSSVVMGRLLPRRAAIVTMARASRGLAPTGPPTPQI